MLFKKKKHNKQTINNNNNNNNKNESVKKMQANRLKRSHFISYSWKLNVSKNEYNRSLPLPHKKSSAVTKTLLMPSWISSVVNRNLEKFDLF